MLQKTHTVVSFGCSPWQRSVLTLVIFLSFLAKVIEIIPADLGEIPDIKGLIYYLKRQPVTRVRHGPGQTWDYERFSGH
jgi:hypothetical protein